MWHPSPEELARLLDEAPTPAEAEHLAACSDCTAELDAMRAEHDALGALPRILPVPTSWEVVRHRLDREGLLTSAPRRSAWMPGAAAAIALFLTGGATGVVFAGGLIPEQRQVAVADSPDRPVVETAAPQPAPDRSTYTVAGGQTPDAEDRVPAAGYRAAGEERAQPGSGRQLAANETDLLDMPEDELPSLYGTPSPSSGATPNWQVLAARASNARTPDEAARFVRDAESAYLAAMTRLAELTDASSSDPAVRLATLDGIVVTTAAALERAPADPVINGYYLAARAQRDALLRTVSSSPQQDPWY